MTTPLSVAKPMGNERERSCSSNGINTLKAILYHLDISDPCRALWMVELSLLVSHCRGEENRQGNPGGRKVEGISHFWWLLDVLSFPDLDQHVFPCGFLFLSTNVRSWTYGVLRGSGLLSMTVQWYFEFSSFCWNPAAIVFFWNIRPDCWEGEIEHYSFVWHRTRIGL